MRNEMLGYEIRKDKTDKGRTVFDVYEIYVGDSEYVMSFYSREQAVEYVRENGGIVL